MNRKLTALMVGGVLVCVLGTKAMAAEEPQNVEAVPISAGPGDSLGPRQRAVLRNGEDHRER